MTSITGYADRWSAAPGETVQFMVSCSNAIHYNAELVRLRQPLAGPQATPFEPERVNAPCNGSYCGRHQEIPIGSLAVVSHPELALSGSFTVMAYIRPTTPTKGRQAIIGTWSEQERQGYGLGIDYDGSLQLLLGETNHGLASISTGIPMTARWYLVAATYDADKNIVTLWQEPLEFHNFHTEYAITTVTATVPTCLKARGPLTMAAWSDGTTSTSSAWGDLRFTCHFNGCIDRPRVARGVLTRAEISVLDKTPCDSVLAERLVAAWDFSLDITSDNISDLGPQKLHGVVLNQPTRAIPGHNWTEEESDWTKAPQMYGAIHFHDDDLIDANWDPDFAFTVPDDMRSGIYAIRLSAETSWFWIPFVVRPSRGEARADIVFLLPTATYTAYQNHRGRFMSLANERLHGRLNVIDAIDAMFIEAPEMGLSTYDRHTDGSGVVYASQHRPAQNIRPDGRLWNFNVDLFIVDWLERLGVAYDVITDDDLHAEGQTLLKLYRVVITGSHPEYASGQMLDALEAHLRAGGRLMYMGGNGFYWRIAYHPIRQGVIEVRRMEGVRAWDADPGSYHMSFTGQRGGLWRRTARAPQHLVGVGFIAQGFDRCSYFRRTQDSFNPRIAWAFDGIVDDIIGDFGVLQGGAAGIEIDATDIMLGTPQHAIVIARSENHSNTYELAVEEVLVSHGATDALINPDIRAEMTFFETPRGGAVFSTGSIAYAGSIGWNNFDNNIFKLTTNVLQRFMDPSPFDMPSANTLRQHFSVSDAQPSGRPDGD